MIKQKLLAEPVWQSTHKNEPIFNKPGKGAQLSTGHTPVDVLDPAWPLDCGSALADWDTSRVAEGLGPRVPDIWLHI